MGKTDDKGEPVKTVRIGGREVEVPIIFILPEESGEKEIERYEHPKVHIKKDDKAAESKEEPLEELTDGKLEEIEKPKFVAPKIAGGYGKAQALKRTKELQDKRRAEEEKALYIEGGAREKDIENQSKKSWESWLDKKSKKVDINSMWYDMLAAENPITSAIADKDEIVEANTSDANKAWEKWLKQKDALDPDAKPENRGFDTSSAPTSSAERSRAARRGFTRHERLQEGSSEQPTGEKIPKLTEGRSRLGDAGKRGLSDDRKRGDLGALATDQYDSSGKKLAKPYGRGAKDESSSMPTEPLLDETYEEKRRREAAYWNLIQGERGKSWESWLDKKSKQTNIDKPKDWWDHSKVGDPDNWTPPKKHYDKDGNRIPEKGQGEGKAEL